MTESTASVTVRLLASPDLADTAAVYSNHVQATFTPHELTLHFGFYAIPALPEPPESGQIDVQVRQLVKVSIPLNLARGIVGLLEQQADGWERNFGMPLPEPPAGTVLTQPRQEIETAAGRATDSQ